MGNVARQFKFGRCLGRGSFGEVYSATMRSAGGLESPVAVKLLRADLDLRGEAVQRLRDEGRLLGRLNHPAILKVFDLVTLRGRLALITERVDGADLTDCIAHQHAIPVRALLQSMAQIASALDAASTSQGPDGPLRLVHRDVKPSNIRVDMHGQAKLLDFGVARFDASDREVRTASDLVVGSIPYMAPERFIERRVDPSSDVFSIGCTIYEGIARQRFYGGQNVGQISALGYNIDRYKLQLSERLAAIDVDSAVSEVLGDLLNHDPTARPTANEASARLEEIADGLKGPTLRMWCRDHDWSDAEPIIGPLEGETLTEGELELVVADPSGGPRVHRRPVETAETEVPPTMPLETPPAFPTLTPASQTDLALLESAAEAALPRGVVEGSDWDRPYTTETERTGEEPVSPASSLIDESGPSGWTGLGLAFVAMSVIVLVGGGLFLVMALLGLVWNTAV